MSSSLAADVICVGISKEIHDFLSNVTPSIVQVNIREIIFTIIKRFIATNEENIIIL